MALDYFYDQQLRRYLLQFTRIFSGFQYQSGVDASGVTQLKTVPVSMASSNRQALSIIRNNSENTIISCPQISCILSSLKMVPAKRQDPSFVRQVTGIERDIDPITNKYTSGPGRRFTVESVMPVPYNMMMQVDIWTSNELMKQQILEQILVIFNPSIEIQSGVDSIDWSSLTNVELTDVNWTNKTYPVGSSDQIEIASLTFEVPIWINAPSKLQKQQIINQIIVDIKELNEELDRDKICPCVLEPHDNEKSTGKDLISRLVVTPEDFCILVFGGEITLMKNGSNHDLEGNVYSWIDLLTVYGKFRNNISKIELKPFTCDVADNSTNIYGTLSLNVNDMNKLFWTVALDSLKPNTLTPIDAIIDASNPPPTFPNKPPIGTRYMLVNSTCGCKSWNSFEAFENDIIEYTNKGWQVVFPASKHSRIEYMINGFTNEQYLWTGNQWQLSIDGMYEPGFWRLFL
jgi:hypothetical protein